MQVYIFCLMYLVCVRQCNIALAEFLKDQSSAKHLESALADVQILSEIFSDVIGNHLHLVIETPPFSASTFCTDLFLI